MKKMLVTLKNSDGSVGVSSGYLVEIVPFAVTVAHKVPGGWSVSNADGYAITQRPAKSMKRAIEVAKRDLELLGAAGYQAAVDRLAAAVAPPAPAPVEAPPPPPKPPVAAARPSVPAPPENNWATVPAATAGKRLWPKPGDIVRLLYSKTKYPGMPFRFRKGKILIVARKRPMNVLVELDGGKLLTVPVGNCKVEIAA
jgi:hypothetical protein